jgi:SAM-dependent methyltransferase
MEAAPGPTAYFDPSELALRGDLEATHWWHLHRREVIRRELARLAPPREGLRLAEIGCGLGTVATHLVASGWVVDYVDVFDEALQLARARAHARLGARADELRFVRGDHTEGAPVSGVDGVLLLDVIEHLPDDVGALANARAALGPGDGTFVLVTVPAFPILWSPWDELERHRRRYTPRSLARALREAGLVPVRQTCFFAPAFPAALAVKAARRGRDGLRRAAGLGAAAPPRTILDAVEAKHSAWLDRAMLALLAPERRLLAGRRVPFGTSLLAVARPRGAA